MKRIGGAGEVGDVRKGETSWQEREEQRVRRDCDYKSGTAAGYRGSERLRNPLLDCAIGIGHLGIILRFHLAKAPSLRLKTGSWPRLREYSERQLRTFGHMRLTGWKLQLQIRKHGGGNACRAAAYAAVRLELHRHRKENGMLNRAGTMRKQ